MKDIDSIIYAEQQEITPSIDDQLDIVQLLNKIFISFAVNQCHPRDLVVALYQGRYLEENQRLVWRDFLANDIDYNMGMEGHFFSQSSFINQVCIESPRRTLRDDAANIRLYFYAIHRLIADQVVVLNEKVLTQTSVEEAYEAIEYEHREDVGDNAFIGFNLMQLYSKMLGYWWHSGLLHTEGCVDQLFYGIRYRFMVAMEAMSGLYKQWMEYVSIVMEGVDEFISHIRLVKLEDYTIEDSSRISLIAWESMLDYLDQINVLIVPTREPYGEDSRWYNRSCCSLS